MFPTYWQQEKITKIIQRVMAGELAYKYIDK
jgi:hypothetical protein